MKPIGCALSRLAIASLSIFTCAAAHAQQVPELIYYKFNEGSGTSVVNYALPGVGSAGTAHGHTLGAGGQFGGALNGVGGSSTINFVDTGWVTALGTGSWTIGFWFDNRTTGAGTILQYLFGDVTATSLRIFSEGVAGHGNLILRGPVADVVVNGAASTTSANAVAWVYDSTVPEIRAYLNGVLVNTVAQPPGVSVIGTAHLKVAGYSSSTALYANGKMDEFRLYSRALGAAEIAATWNIELQGPADLSITKTDGVTSAVPGGSVTYTITASNAGPDQATGATVADTFPAILTPTWTCVGAGGGTCTASGAGNINDTVNLPAGASVTYTVTASINASAAGTLSNTATVAAPAEVTDPNPGNNAATDTDTLVPQADLAITKTDGVTTATPGGSVTYTITAFNAGPSNAPGAAVADTFPASLTPYWTCIGAGGGTCTASGTGNINDTVNLPAGGSVTYTVSASINASSTGTLSNTATVAAPAGVTDPNPGNNAATDTDTLTPDTTPPAVTPPAAITIDQTLCCGSFGGASPDSSAELLAFVNAGTATDDRDPSPIRLPARVGGTDVAGSTCFEAGTTTVTFRFQDEAGNIGTATSQANVQMFGDLNADTTADPSDMVVLRAYFNFVIAPGTPPFNAPLRIADLDHDAVVDPSDIIILRAFFNFVVGCLAP